MNPRLPVGFARGWGAPACLGEVSDLAQGDG
jgi:hypothetical protein